LFPPQEPIPTHLLKKVTLIEDRSWLLERQHEVVQRYLDGALEQAPGGYGAKVLHLRPVRYGRKRVKGTLGSFVPNAEQQQALEHGLGSQVTIIVGAAGTGKSAVQALLCTRFLQQGYSILSLSHTNSATDNLFLDQVQFLEESGDADLFRLLREGRIVRAGDPRHISLLQGAYRRLTVSAIAEARTEQAGTRLRLEEAHQALVKNIKDLTHRLQRVEGRWQAERAALEQRRAALEAILAPLEEQEQKRLEGIERDLEMERQKRAAARQHLDALVMQQANLERHLDRWQGELECRRMLLGMAQQRLVALEQTGAVKRWLAARHYQQEVQEAQHEVPGVVEMPVEGGGDHARGPSDAAEAERIEALAGFELQQHGVEQRLARVPPALRLGAGRPDRPHSASGSAPRRSGTHVHQVRVHLLTVPSLALDEAGRILTLTE